MKKYLHVSKEDAQRLVNGEEVEVTIGNKIQRTMVTKSLLEIKKAELEAKFAEKLAKLEEKEGK